MRSSVLICWRESPSCFWTRDISDVNLEARAETSRLRSESPIWHWFCTLLTWSWSWVRSRACRFTVLDDEITSRLTIMLSFWTLHGWKMIGKRLNLHHVKISWGIQRQIRKNPLPKLLEIQSLMQLICAYHRTVWSKNLCTPGTQLISYDLHICLCWHKPFPYLSSVKPLTEFLNFNFHLHPAKDTNEYEGCKKEKDDHRTNHNFFVVGLPSHLSFWCLHVRFAKLRDENERCQRADLQMKLYLPSVTGSSQLQNWFLISNLFGSQLIVVISNDE